MNESMPFLDESSRTALHFDSVFAKFEPLTAEGKRQKQNSLPFLPGDEEKFQTHYETFRRDADTWDETKIASLESALKRVPDLGAVLDTLENAYGVLRERDFLRLKQFLFYGRDVMSHLESRSPEQAMSNIFNDLSALLGQADSPAFSLVHGRHPGLDAAAKHLRECTRACRDERDREDEACREVTGTTPDNAWNVVFRGTPGTRQTPMHERLRWLSDTPWESTFAWQPSEVYSAAEKSREAAQMAFQDAEQRVREELTQRFRNRRRELAAIHDVVADVDLRVARVRFLRQIDGSLPQLGRSVFLENGRHPLVEERLVKQGQLFTPITWSGLTEVNVLSGANMGGKTLAMSVLALCQALAQYGLPIPAQQFHCRLFSCLRFTESPVTDMEQGLSSFGREIVRLREMWEARAHGRTFLLLDEPLRSTNPREGQALALGLLRAAKDGMGEFGHCVIMATHYSICEEESDVSQFAVAGVDTSVIDRDIGASRTERIQELCKAMRYGIVRREGSHKASSALSIAKWLGLPDGIYEEAVKETEKGENPHGEQIKLVTGLD